jgi:hypothetical protein
MRVSFGSRSDKSGKMMWSCQSSPIYAEDAYGRGRGTNGLICRSVCVPNLRLSCQFAAQSVGNALLSLSEGFDVGPVPEPFPVRLLYSPLLYLTATLSDQFLSPESNS